MDATPVILELTNLHCYDEGDSIGSAEPYLWTVFFKIDGDSVHIDNTLTLRGTATVVATVGNHGDIGPGGVGAGDDIPIPASLGRFETTVKPIPLDVPIGSLVDFPGTVGCIIVLLEQDSTSDDAVAAGRAALTSAVQDALDTMIPTLNVLHTAPTQEELDAMTAQIGKAVEDAISDQVSIWDWLGALGNMDDKIGSAVLRYSQADLDAAAYSGIPISQEWENEGDWLITGSASAVIDELTIGCIHKPSGNVEAHHIERVGGVYNGSNWRMTRDQVIQFLQQGKRFGVAGADGSHSDVEVFKHWVSNANPTGLYIATTRDGSKADNLLSLPDCGD
ncbi:MAG: DUF3892 domain-containing protein [Proteobacteria bacterium]|nr:DUF3892 domain-containing protein [Pseudomonadota bacterium]